MKIIDFFLFGLVILMWSLFLFWEMDINNLDSSIKGKIIRFDLILIPVYILVTVCVFWTILKRKGKQ